MTRKHFEAFARIVRSIHSETDRVATMRSMCEMFAAENPRFNRERFERACEPERTVHRVAA